MLDFKQMFTESIGAVDSVDRDEHEAAALRGFEEIAAALGGGVLGDSFVNFTDDAGELAGFEADLVSNGLQFRAWASIDGGSLKFGYAAAEDVYDDIDPEDDEYFKVDKLDLADAVATAEKAKKALTEP